MTVLFTYFAFPPTKGGIPASVNTWDRLYDAIAEECLDFETEVVVSTNLNFNEFDYDKLREVLESKDKFKAGCLYGVTWNGAGIGDYSSVKMHFKYYINKSEHDKVIKIAKDIAREIRNYTDYEKIKTVHDYLIDINNYNIGSHGPYRALYKGQANCNGYALSFLAIMRECGIDCTYETGDNHAWNAVKLDGEWYNIDVTWDDSGVWDKEGGVEYDYFLKSDADWEGHHHGSATAKTSYPADLSVNKKLKNFATSQRITTFIVIAIVVVGLGVGWSFYKKHKNKQTFKSINESYTYNSQQKNIQNSNTPPQYSDDDITCGR